MVYLSGENFIKYKKLRDSNHVLLFMESPQRTKAAHVTHPSSSTKPAALRELLATRWHYKKAKKKKKASLCLKTTCNDKLHTQSHPAGKSQPVPADLVASAPALFFLPRISRDPAKSWIFVCYKLIP